jgi:hypothetical protein
MANQLKMAEHQAILGPARLKWSYRRLGVDRETVSRHVKAMKAPTTAAPPRQRRARGQPPLALMPHSCSGLNGTAVVAGKSANGTIVTALLKS